MVLTKKFSEFDDGGDLKNDETTVGLQGGVNARFNNPWTFLPDGTSGDRPTPDPEMYYRLRFNTTLESYEYYSPVTASWVQIEDSLDIQSFPFVIYKAEPLLPNAFDLGTLSSGMLKQTVSLGISTPSIAVNGTDYYGPGFAGYFIAPAGIADINSNPILTTTTAGASAVNSLRVVNSITGNPVLIEGIGTDTDVGVSLITKGAGQIRLESGNGTEPIVIVSGTLGSHITRFDMANTSADRTATWQDSDGTIAWLSDVLGTVTSAEGTENQVLVNGNFGTQETGACVFSTPQDIAPTSLPTFDSLTLTSGIILDPNANNAIQFTYVASAVNYLRTYNSATGNPVRITAQGTDANVSMTLESLGDGNISFVPAGIGSVTAGSSTLFTGTGSGFFSFEVAKSGAQAFLSVGSFKNNASPSVLGMYKSRSTTVGSHTTVNSGDTIGATQYNADDGTNYVTAAQIDAAVSSAPSTGIIPTILRFSTCNTSGALTLGMTLSSSQALSVVSNITSSTGIVASGTAAGGVVGQFQAFPTTAALGSLSLTVANNAGDYANVLTNASTSAARTWTLPDASGTIALTSGIPSLGNYSFSGNDMTVASGTMNFNLPSSILTLTGSGDTEIRPVSTGTTGSPLINFYRNTSTQIGAVQAGVTSGGDSGGSGMFYANVISGGAHYFWTSPGGTFATLDPAGSSITTGNFTVLGGTYVSGVSSGGVAGSYKAFTNTASMGSIALTAADNGGNYANVLTNASTSAARTWTLPDATGTIALTGSVSSGYVLTSPAALQTITGFDLTINTVRVGLGGGSVSSNVVVGISSLANAATTGTNAVAIGSGAMTAAYSGNGTIAIGTSAAAAAVSADDNVCIGDISFNALTTGDNNVGVGYRTGSNAASGSTAITTGSFNTLLGSAASVSTNSTAGAIAIGANAVADPTTGGTSSDLSPGIAIGSASVPVGVAGDGSIIQTAGASAGYWRVKINGTYYKIPIFADA